MKSHIKERVILHANLMISNDNTIRSVARMTGWSKSTVLVDLKKRLPIINPELYQKVKNKVKYNTAIRHIRGGQATKLKYSEED